MSGRKPESPPLDATLPTTTRPTAGRESVRGTRRNATFAEFFAGIGLVREAIEPLGWECVFANDIADDKAAMYGARFGLRDYVVDDVRRLSVHALPAEIDLATASFPCIDLSLAGNRAGLAGKHSGTIWPFLDLLTARSRQGKPPAAVLLENVTGFLSSRGGRDLTAVCGRLGGLGYVVDLAVVNARWFTPQSRPRLFVLAVRSGSSAAAAAARVSPAAIETRIRPRAVRRFQGSHPRLPFVELPLPEPPQSAPHGLSSLLEAVPPDDARWWPEERTEALLANMAAAHRHRVEELAAGQRNGVATMFRRRRHGRTVGEVRSDDIAGCLRTPQGGSSVQFLVDCRSGKPRIRPLTGREYARLQGAADFPIDVGDRQAQMGFGDAVCVPAVRWLVQHAFRHVPAMAAATAPAPSPLDCGARTKASHAASVIQHPVWPTCEGTSQTPSRHRLSPEWRRQTARSQ